MITQLSHGMSQLHG